MTDIIAHMNAEDLSKLIDYIVKHDTGNMTVGDIKEELGLTNDEFNELYTLAMPAIREYNECRFWCIAYQQLEAGLICAVNGKLAIDDKIVLIKDILKCKSLRKLKKERMEGRGAA